MNMPLPLVEVPVNVTLPDVTRLELPTGLKPRKELLIPLIFSAPDPAFASVFDPDRFAPIPDVVAVPLRLNVPDVTVSVSLPLNTTPVPVLVYAFAVMEPTVVRVELACNCNPA